MNPFEKGTKIGQQSWLSEIVSIEQADVLTVKSHQSGDNISHEVQIDSRYFEEPVIAAITVNQIGDITVPTQGDRVIVAYQIDGRPIILGTIYTSNDTLPDFEPGERIIGHPMTDSYVRLATDGTIHVEGDGGNTIELQPDGSIVLNGGSTQPVTDVQTTTDVDGHVTSVSLTRADGIYVPE